MSKINSDPIGPVQILADALLSAGVDPAPLNLREETETVWFPGSNYAVHNIVADFADGRQERYDVDLMLKSPRVTVVEIQSRIRRNNGA